MYTQIENFENVSTVTMTTGWMIPYGTNIPSAED